MTDSLANLVGIVCNLLTFAVIGRALLSWFDPTFKTSVGRMIVAITEPIVGPIRKLIPSAGMFDFSPIVAVFLLQIISRLLQSSLNS